MSAIIPFEFPATGQQVRVVGDADAPLFHHGDVCKVLQHTNPSVAARMLEDDESVMIDLRDIAAGQTALNSSFPAPATGNSTARFVTEAGLYSLILSSRAPGAKAFRRWLVHEVIPSIRRTGSYSTRPAELSRGEILRLALAAEEEAERLRAERAELTGRVEELEPAAAAWDALASAVGDYSLRDAAAILSRDPNIKTGQNRLMETLRELRMVDAKGTPYARHVDAGRLVERVRAYVHPHSGESVLGRPQVRVTVAGLRYLHTKLGGVAPLRFDQPPLGDVA